MAMIKCCFPRISASSDDGNYENKPLISQAKSDYSYMDEKIPLYPSDSRTQTINNIFVALQSANLNSKTSQGAVKATVDDIIRSAGGWQEWIAEGVLNKFVEAVTAGFDSLPENWKQAFLNAKEGAEKVAQDAADFAQEHPIITTIICVVIALGMLYLLAPYILELLGFESLGPRLGSWAARWQSLYGDVPTKSLFSYLQRLGMTWTR